VAAPACIGIGDVSEVAGVADASRFSAERDPFIRYGRLSDWLDLMVSEIPCERTRAVASEIVSDDDRRRR
jgi:hypothetical protein